MEFKRKKSKMIDFSKLLKKRAQLTDAIVERDLESVRFILGDLSTGSKQLFNLNYTDRDGQSPLHRSCFIGDLSIVKLLINNGASQDIPNKDGWFPIHLASFNAHIDIVKYLIDESNLNSQIEPYVQYQTGRVRVMDNFEYRNNTFTYDDSDESDYETDEDEEDFDSGDNNESNSSDSDLDADTEPNQDLDKYLIDDCFSDQFDEINAENLFQFENIKLE